jgi:hypothetical protein
MHVAPMFAFIVPQVLPVHVFDLQAVPVIGQSVGMAQATHLPMPSQTLPPLSAHVVPAVAFVPGAQQPIEHFSGAHVDCDMHWLSIVHVVPASPHMAPLELADVEDVDVVDDVGVVLVDVVVDDDALAPPAPPVPLPGILLLSTAVISSQPEAASARAPPARTKAVKTLRMEVINASCSAKSPPAAI